MIHSIIMVPLCESFAVKSLLELRLPGLSHYLRYPNQTWRAQAEQYPDLPGGLLGSSCASKHLLCWPPPSSSSREDKTEAAHSQRLVLLLARFKAQPSAMEDRKGSILKEQRAHHYTLGQRQEKVRKMVCFMAKTSPRPGQAELSSGP